MDPLERLAALFEKFPGIGPRQAQRFVQFLLRSSPATRRELSQAVQTLGGSVHQCPSCMRFHAGEKKLCGLCASTARDDQYLAVVANDPDLLALEKSGTYRGRYFVLGGTIHLARDNKGLLRTKQLLASIPARLEKGLQEIILAFPANPEGDETAEYMRDELAKAGVKITTLGRGLSTGSELEYADPDTLKSAFESRR